MYRIFKRPLYELPKINSPSMDRIRDLILYQFDYHHRIYRAYGSFIPNEHILIKLCYILDNYIAPGVDVYRTVQTDSHRICSALFITSIDTPGIIHKKAFYTNQCIIFSVTYEESLMDTDWKSLRPVRCLTHPGIMLDVKVPPVTRKHFSDGIAAVSIDLALFAYQFQQWTIFNNLKPELEREQVNMFITKYVLTAMVPEQIDISLRNRLTDIYNKKITPPNPLDRAFAISYGDALIYPLNRILSIINNSRSTYLKGLNEIPFIFKDNYLDAIPMEIAQLSSYSYWAVCLIYLEWLYPLVSFIENDQTQITDISKILVRVHRYLLSSGTLKYMPEETRDLFFIKYDICRKKFLKKEKNF